MISELKVVQRSKIRDLMRYVEPPKRSSVTNLARLMLLAIGMMHVHNCVRDSHAVRMRAPQAQSTSECMKKIFTVTT
jgi:hypothetical protein